MNDVPINFTLLGDATGAVAAARSTDAALAQSARSARDYARELGQVQQVLSKLSSGVSFQGSRSRAQIASDLAERIPNTLGPRLARADLGRRTASAGGNEFAREIERQRNELRDDESRRQQAEADNARFAERLQQRSPTRQRAVKKLQNKFIQENDLGDVADVETQGLARGLRQLRQNLIRNVRLSLRETGGDVQELRAAAGQGVDVARPLAVRQFTQTRAIAHETAIELERAQPRQVVVEREMVAAHDLARQPERERIATAFGAKPTDVLLPRGREGYTQVESFARERDEQARVDSERRAMAIQAERNRNASDRRGRIAERQSVLRGNAPTLRRIDDDLLAAPRRELVERVPAGGDGLIAGGADEPLAEDKKRYDARRARIATRQGRLRGRGTPMPERIDDDLLAAPRVDDEGSRFSAGEGLLGSASEEVGDADRGERESRSLTRSNRLARRDALLKQRRNARLAAAGQVVTGIAGAGTAAIYFGNEIAAGYSQKMGGDYFDALKGTETQYRSLMGLSGNETRQPELREYVRNKAVNYGMNTGMTADALYEVISASGNMNEADQRKVFDTSLRLQSVAGGDLNTVSGGLIAFQNIYGDQTGSIERSGALVKAAADYGKFSTTAFAQLGPDSLAYFKQYGYSPEEANAFLSVGSLKTGRNENFFTGAKYVASNMGDAIKRGWTTKKELGSQLQDLSTRTPEELTDVFGREGFVAISNGIASASEIGRVTTQFRGVRGEDLNRQQVRQLADPVNLMSRIAQSADVAGSQGLELLMESGGPEGQRLAGQAIVQKMAMDGQKLLAPITASLTDKTKAIDLETHLDEYSAVAKQQQLVAGAKEGLAGRTKNAGLRLLAGDVEIANPTPQEPGKVAGFVSGLAGLTFGDDGGNAADYVLGIERPSTRRSDGSDVAKYEAWVKREHVTGATATNYAQYQSLLNTGHYADAASVLTGFKAQYAKNVQPTAATAATAAPAVAIDLSQFDISKQIAAARVENAKTLRPVGMSDSQVEDAANTRTIEGALAGAKADVTKYTKAKDLYGADAASDRARAITLRKRDLTTDDGVYSASDRRTLAREITGVDRDKTAGAQIADAGTKMIAASDKLDGFANKLEQILGRIGSGVSVPAPPPGTKPTNQPSGPPAGPRVPVGGGARPVIVAG